MVSFFFYTMRKVHNGDHWRAPHQRALFERVFGQGYDPKDARSNLSKFIRHIVNHPRGSRLSWQQHIDSWYDPESRPHVCYISYEALRTNTIQELTRVVEHINQDHVDSWEVEIAVEKYSMERQTGRKPGEEDISSFIRKGVAGDWKNHFTREAGELFNDLAGDALVKLGYEIDLQWPTRTKFVDD